MRASIIGLIASAFRISSWGDYNYMPLIRATASNNITFKGTKVKQYGKRHRSQNIRSNRRKAKKRVA